MIVKHNLLKLIGAKCIRKNGITYAVIPLEYNATAYENTRSNETNYYVKFFLREGKGGVYSGNVIVPDRFKDDVLSNPKLSGYWKCIWANMTGKSKSLSEADFDSIINNRPQE